MAVTFQVSVFCLTSVVDLSKDFFMHSSNSPPVTHWPLTYVTQNKICSLSLHQHFFNIFYIQGLGNVGPLPVAQVFFQHLLCCHILNFYWEYKHGGTM